MDVKIGSLLLAIFVFTCAHGVSHVGDHSEMDELRAMLTESRDQNRRLEQQMNRLKLVWTGLQKMCEVLSTPCTCEDAKHVYHENDYGMPVKTEQTSKKTQLLRILTATSSGNETGEVTVSVTYMAAEEHATTWYYYRAGQGNDVRTTGNTTRIGENKYRNTIVIHTHNMNMNALAFSLYSENETAYASFDIDDLVKPSHQTIPDPEPAILQVDIGQIGNLSTGKIDTISPISQMDANYLNELSIAFLVNKTNAKLSQISEPHASIVGLKKTEDATPSQYEVYNGFSGNDDNIEVSRLSVSKTTSSYVITLKPPLLKRGGILTVNFPVEVFGLEDIKGHLLWDIEYGYAIHILPFNSTELVPKNTVALVEMPEMTVMRGPTHTVACTAMGNPSPVVQIFRQSPNGRRKKLPTEETDFDKTIRGAFYTLDTSDKRTPGTYVCRAQSGTAVAENQTEVVVYEPVKFDDARTGVIKNNSKYIVFGCKARGKDKPQLEFRLYEQYGPNLALMENSTIKVSESKSGKTTSRIHLTVSPPNSDIHTVYCVSRLHGEFEYRRIELFPGTYPGWNYFLYDQSRNSTDPYDDNLDYQNYYIYNSTHPY